MKWGMFNEDNIPTLSAYQVAALRMLSAGLIMLPFLRKALKEIPKKTLGYVLLSGWLGSFFPSFLFCIAESKIDSALAGSLNALSPLFFVITGVLFFNTKTAGNKIMGIVIGILGSALLTYANYNKPFEYIAYSGFVVIATFLYGLNVNMVQRKLQGVSSTSIAAVAFTGLIIPAFFVLIITGYFKTNFSQHQYIISTIAASTLGVVGTAIASIFFYMLVKRAGGLFASMVTYGIPFVAILWGVFYKEHITYLHIVALLIILFGVYWANRNKAN